MFNLKLGSIALAFEIAGWGIVSAMGERSDTALLGYFVLHAVASAVLALCVFPMLRGGSNRARWPMLCLISVFAFVVPILGFVSVVLAALTIRNYPLLQNKVPFASIELPEFDVHQQMQGTPRTAGMRALLNNAQVPAQSRFEALVSLSHVSGHIASPMLKDVLNDRSDDLRLLAYGMLDRMEQKISRAIHEKSQILSAAQAYAAKHQAPLSPRGVQAAHSLADLYWELIYQGLASDDMRDFAVQQSLAYSEIVLAQDPDDGPLIVRKGRLLQALGRRDEASACYDKALALKLPKTQVLPYQAEIHFHRGEFDQVRAVMRTLKPHNSLPKLRPVIDYWS